MGISASIYWDGQTAVDRKDSEPFVIAGGPTFASWICGLVGEFEAIGRAALESLYLDAVGGEPTWVEPRALAASAERLAGMIEAADPALPRYMVESHEDGAEALVEDLRRLAAAASRIAARGIPAVTIEVG